MQNDKKAELADQFLLFIGDIVRGMDCIFRREMERFDVTWPQYHLLKVIKTVGRMSVTELSNSLMIAPPTASRMVDGLCNKGLLEKVKDTVDQRVTYVTITGKSESLLEKLLALEKEVMSEAFEGEDPVELERTIRNLSRISGRWFAMSERRAAAKAGSDG